MKRGKKSGGAAAGRKSGSSRKEKAIPKHAHRGFVKRASIFRNGANQAVRLPQELRFAEDVKEVKIRRQGDGLLISPVKADWASFFALNIDVPEDFLSDRDQGAPQTRESL